MVLRVNLGPLHLMDSLVDEVIAIDPSKSYVRKESRISEIVSKDINKSAAIATYEKNNEKKIQISSFFLDWQFIPMIKVYIMSIIFHDYKVCICKRIKNSRKITQIINLEQKITLKFLIVKIKFGEKFLKFWSASGKSFGFLRKYLPLAVSVREWP